MEIIKNFFKKNGISILKILFIIFMIIFIVYGIAKEIKSIDFLGTIALVRNFSPFYILLLSILGIIAVASITLYDFIIIKYLNMELKPLLIFNVSFVASTINNISGLGGLTGASIRSVFFKKRANDSKDIIDYNLLLVSTTAVGLSVMALVSLLEYKYIKDIINEYRFLIFALVGFFIYLIFYFFMDKLINMFSKNKKINTNISRIIVRVKLLMASILEWTLAYVLFSTILKYFDKSINLFAILGIFTLGSIAGIISMLPGGIGSFDFVVLVGFQYLGISSEYVLATLVLYRLFYYIIPLILGIVFTLIAQSYNGNTQSMFLNMDKLKGIINITSPFTNILLSILVFSSGAVLLASALVPGISSRLKLASRLMSFNILQWSHQISITIGILLITISKDIAMKVKRAYKFTWWLLLLGAFFTFLKGFDYEEAVFLVIVLILLRLSKDSFYRRSIPFNWFWTAALAIFVLIGVIIYFKLSNIIIMDFFKAYHIKTIFVREFINFKRKGIITYGSFLGFLIFKEISKERFVNDHRYECLDEDRLLNFLETNGGHYHSHLLFLNDKHIFWSNTNEVIIAFEKRHNIIIALGDPMGNPMYFGEAIDEFQSYIDEYGLKSIFYECSDNLLPLYHDHGYYFFKLGETALVDLQEFDISSPKCRDFRNILSRFKRDGYYFKLINKTKIDDDLYSELLTVSDEWLEGRNEMGFSLGFMDRNYLEHSPIALICKIDTNEIIAFASLMPKYDNNQSMSIDLMRFKKEVPSNTMQYLILNLMIKLKEDGYKTLNLGMAPLSNVGSTSNAHLIEKMAHLVFKYGKNLYSFGGLRKYKEKFSPRWESRYLAYEDLTLLPSSLIEATILIHSRK